MPKQPNEKCSAFVINNEAEYPWTVVAHVPGPSGKRIKMKFEARFKHVDADRKIEILEDYQNAIKAQAIRPETDDEDESRTLKRLLGFEGMLLREVLVGWKGVVDKDGAEFPFSEENLLILCKNEWAKSAAHRCYIQSLSSRNDQGN